MLHRISAKTAGIGIILTNVFTIFIFLLIIFKALSYNSIGGGRLGSYQAACESAITSIVILSYGIPLIAIVSGLIRLGRFKAFFKAWLLVGFVLIVIFGRLESYQAIVMISFGIPLSAIASGLMKLERYNLFLKIYLWFSFVMISLNTILNLLGITLFERLVMGLVTIIQAVLLFRLATDKRQLKMDKK
ncbi:MAG: hypothetical protein K6T85_04560 [Gorillibacterium sp.]|nr:hypothetical protein [Gorillibacterium sp.]